MAMLRSIGKPSLESVLNIYLALHCEQSTTRVQNYTT